MATKSQIIHRALVRAGVLEALQTATGDQFSQLDDTLTAIHESWVDKKQVRWSLDSIPVEVENDVVSRLAFAIADDFGVSPARYQRLQLADIEALRNIQSHNAIPYSGSSQIEPI